MDINKIRLNNGLEGEICPNCESDDTQTSRDENNKITGYYCFKCAEDWKPNEDEEKGINKMSVIYIVSGISGDYEDKTERNLYVGTDKEKAFEFITSDDFYTHTLNLEVWANGIQVEGYRKYLTDSNDWSIYFDKIKDLRDQIENSKRILKNSEDELLALENHIGLK